MKKVEPRGHHVLVEVEEISDKTPGGLYKPQVSQEREQNQVIMGVVREYGPHAWRDEYGEQNPWAEVGDKVIFAKYGGMAISEDITGEDKFLRLLLDTDVLAVLREG